MPARASSERPFVRDKDILQREAKEGAAGLTTLGYGIVLAITLSILALNAWALVRLAAVTEAAEPPPRQRRGSAAPRRPFEDDPERFVSVLREFIGMTEPSSYDERDPPPARGARA